MGAFRTSLRAFGGAGENLQDNASYSRTPYLDMVVQIVGFMSIFVGAVLLMALVFAAERGPYAVFGLVLIAGNVALLSLRVWKRRRR